MSAANPRIAILGFAIECNRFSPVSTAADFAADVDIRGEAILAEARAKASGLLPDTPGFFAEMDRGGPWTPVPLRIALAQPGGPVEQSFFEGLVAEIVQGLKAAGPLDGVFIASHGAALATGSDDPDGDLFAAIRGAVGPDLPVIGVFDLHANVSRQMTDNLSAFVGYLCNPHTDIGERGREAARHMRAALAGERTAIAMVKIPLVAPSIALLTASGPYGEAIAEGQRRIAGDIINVSIMAGFAFSDCPKNGLTVVVTARNRNRRAAFALARELAARIWNERPRYRKAMTPLPEAVAAALAAGQGKREPVLLADVADNPGGGGRGNTTYLLRALLEAKVEGAVLGVFNDAALAAEAHRLGKGAGFEARFNAAETHAFSQPLTARAQVLALNDGKFVGRRGLIKGVAGDLGPSALLDLGGIRVAVISQRQQCMDPMQLELFGIDIAKARVVILKSRGHFRSGFDEFFPPERIVEVDCPGLTSPALQNFKWTKLPRPVYPLDDHTAWTPPAGE
ncbi:MAG: M81 family metallopeptidase [Alphaproteobacteria bacterium]|nr:M81 family metallopeptidase [Alphaproteobacteria bacterium]